MAEGAETRCDPVAMVALDLHDALLDGAPGPAQALELGRASFELAGRQTAKHGHDLAVAPAALAKDSHHAVLRHARRGRRGRTPRLGLARTSLFRGVDGATVLHGPSVARRRILLDTSRERGDAVAIAQAPLTDVQKQVLARIDEDEVVRLACDLIRIPSFTTEETPCAEWLGNYLRDQGLAAELQEIEPGRKQAVARLRGAGGGRSIMLNGHIDIDPLASGWTRDPFQPWIADGRLYGHGIYNMKAGVTACIMAALALKRSGVRLRGDVVVACVAAELNSGVGTIHAINHGYRTDMAVVAEPYGARTIITKHTGTMDLGRLAKAAVDVPVTEPVVQMVKRNLRTLSGQEPEHLGVRLPQSYAGNDTTHLWQAGIPCCLYGPGGGYTDYHDVHTDLDELFLVTRVLALTALEAAT